MTSARIGRANAQPQCTRQIPKAKRQEILTLVWGCRTLCTPRNLGTLHHKFENWLHRCSLDTPRQWALQRCSRSSTQLQLAPDDSFTSRTGGRHRVSPLLGANPLLLPRLIHAACHNREAASRACAVLCVHEVRLCMLLRSISALTATMCFCGTVALRNVCSNSLCASNC